MTQSEFTYTYPMEKLRGITYRIGIRHDPNQQNIQSFAAILYFPLKDGTRVEVAKVDNSPHPGKQDIHVDRYYREVGANIKEFNTNIGNAIEAENYLKDNWRKFANKYFQNYGSKPRPDGKNI